MELTINLPESTFQRLAQLAELTHQPLAELVLQSITGNLPPAIDNTPADTQAELLAMQKLSADDLRKIAQSQIDPAQQERHLELLDHNQARSLTPAEQQELQQLSLAGDRLMLKKAHACALLRWLGQPIRDLSQLSPG
ncbi:MAG: hypothetical protein LVS60_15890 [Nodosilinea sp. LVE1205-7]|jgi:hypothetical protein